MNIQLVSTTAIGDTVMATPFIRAVRKHYPDARITVMVHHRRMAILEHNPHLNELLIYEGKGKALFRTMWALRRGCFDLAIVLHANDPDIVPLVRWTGAPKRVGWGESKWASLLTHTIRRTTPPEHFLIHKKRLLESAGIPVMDLHTEILFQPKDEKPWYRDVEPWLRKLGAKNFVAMHPFGTNSSKWWPLERFFAMSTHIHQRHGWPAVYVGDDTALSRVESHPDFRADRHFTARHCGIRESAFILKQAKRMLTTDSGPMHLAFAVGCPSLCLFGPTQPSVHGPCFDMEKHMIIHRLPLKDLEVAEVVGGWDEFTPQSTV